MTHRVLAITTWISGIALIASLVLASASVWLDPWQQRLSFGKDVHVGVWSAWGPRLIFFNDAEYGPYRGSTIALVDDGGNTYPRDFKPSGFGDVAGVYYRHFVWTNTNDTLWTLMVSLWYPIVLFAALPGWAIVRRVWARSHGRNPAQ
jgi:hypothetical protein